MSSKKRNDYDISFKKATKLLVREERKGRIREAERMCDKYFDDNGEMPSDYLLEGLADAILNEELSDPNPWKIKNTEYPFMSEHQLIRRTRGHKQRKEFRKVEVPLNIKEIDEVQASGRLGIYETLENKNTPKIFDDLLVEYPIVTYFTEPSPNTVTSTKQLAGRGEESRTWADSVKTRDGYKCQNPKCNSRAGIMHAHHVYNYADYPDRRLDLSNGITLCEPCHKEFHITYGKDHTNEEDLMLFFAV